MTNISSWDWQGETITKPHHDNYTDDFQKDFLNLQACAHPQVYILTKLLTWRSDRKRCCWEPLSSKWWMRSYRSPKCIWYWKFSVCYNELASCSSALEGGFLPLCIYLLICNWVHIYVIYDWDAIFSSGSPNMFAAPRAADYTAQREKLQGCLTVHIQFFFALSVPVMWQRKHKRERTWKCNRTEHIFRV